jgi:hypothetical protein
MNARYRGVDLYGRYWGWFGWAGLLGCFSRTAVMGATALAILHWISGEPPEYGASQPVRIRDFSFFCVIPIFGAGVALGGLPVVCLFRILLGRRYREFVDFCDWKCGFESAKASKLLAAVFGIPSVLVLLVVSMSSWTFDADHLEIRRFGRSTRTYSYRDVTAIALDDLQRNPVSGQEHDREPRFVAVHFRDGQTLKLPSHRFSEDDWPSGVIWAEWLSERASAPLLHLTEHELQTMIASDAATGQQLTANR